MRIIVPALFLVAACNRGNDATVNLPSRPVEAPIATELPPVALNPNTPVSYPPAVALQGLEGTVLLHLFVDTTGRAVAESTRVAESSGYPALDSAALAGVPQLWFAPGERAGVRVPMAFLQPVHFRTPHGVGATP